MAKRICSVAGCPEFTDGGRCDEHKRAADKARGTSRERGYSTPGHKRFRRLVLRRDPICVVCTTALATVVASVETSPVVKFRIRAISAAADHYPVSRRDLVASGANPDDPAQMFAEIESLTTDE